MSEIVTPYLYKISFVYHDLKINEQRSSPLLLPYISETHVSLQDVKKEYLKDNVFQSMVSNMLEESTYKEYKRSDFVYLDFKIKYIGQERWWLGWFYHQTLCKFDSKDETFKDFEKFLEEKGVDICFGNGFESETDYTDGSYVDMGARDSYRWEICGCEHCIKSKYTIIKH